ncbi:HAD-IA family hydrolase [Lachnospiraceae bacterium 62-35]
MMKNLEIKNIKNILFFDVDGTLIDSFEGIKYSLKIAVNQFGLTLPSDEVLRQFVGPPIEKSIETYYSLDAVASKEISQIFQAIYNNKGYKYARLYDNIEDLLKTCENYGKYIVTNKNPLYASKMLKYFGISKFFIDVLCTNREKQINKSHLINEKLKYHSHVISAIMIGDTIEDYKAVLNSVCKFIGVTYGFGFRPGEYYEFVTCDNINELKKKLM